MILLIFVFLSHFLFGKCQLDTSKVLEGITEPFGVDSSASKTPAWKVMKDSADQQALNNHFHQALKEYGNILRQPTIFAEMITEERYDVFLSMASLLKILGFHQRAEVLLYESMSYSQSPFDSHFQLSLLSLEKEDLSSAKMHLKNCLLLKESESLVLIHLAVILMAEGKTHEAKFYISRVLSTLESKVQTLVDVMKMGDKKGHFVSRSPPDAGMSVMEKWNRRKTSRMRTSTHVGHNILSSGDSIDKEDIIIDSFARRVDHGELQQWLEDLFVRVFHGDYNTALISNYIADGKEVGNKLISRSTKTSSLLETFQMFSNLYDWLTDGEMTGRFVFDIGQALYESGRPEVGLMMMTRGYKTSNSLVEGVVSVEVVKIRLAIEFPVIPHSIHNVIEAYLNMTEFISLSSQTYVPINIENIMDVYWPFPLIAMSGLFAGPVYKEVLYRFNGFPSRRDSLSVLWLTSLDEDDAVVNNTIVAVPEDSGVEKTPKIRIGIFGGHMNDHPVGVAVLHRLCTLDKSKFHLTLVATPLYSDFITKEIAVLVDEVVNIPMSSTDKAWQIVERKLTLDVLLFPDWQPYPDQLSMLYMTRRIAPVQICVFVRGGTCGAGSFIDYYVLPEDLSEFYLASTSLNYAISVPTQGKRSSNIETNALNLKNKKFDITIPPWLDGFHEQLVVLDWPVFTSDVVSEIGRQITNLPEEPIVNAENSKSNPFQYSNFLASDKENEFVSEIEAQLFFENQPVAIMAVHPSFIHPLMDKVLVNILQGSPQLQLLLVMPEIHFNHAMLIPRYRISWARRLVRRLWQEAGSVANRIRLLPYPISDKRLLTLFRKADMVLDSFPFGSSLHLHALALSVGTPIITLKSGLILSTPPDILFDLRLRLKNSRKYDNNPVFQYILKHDIPWVPTNCPLAEFYVRLDEGDDGSEPFNSLLDLVAENTVDFALIAVRLAADKEALYKLRIKILDSIDRRTDLIEWNSHKVFGDNAVADMRAMSDIEKFLTRVGQKWAIKREENIQKLFFDERRTRDAISQREGKPKHVFPTYDAGAVLKDKSTRSPKEDVPEVKPEKSYWRSFLNAWVA